MKLEEQMFRKIELQGLRRKTFETYWKKCVLFFKFVNRNEPDKSKWVHPAECGREEIEAWLTDMAVQGCAEDTQNLALQSVLYLYRHVIGKEITDVSALRAKRASRTKEVISVDEVRRLFDELQGVDRLAAKMMYGCCGLRIGDVASIRLKDINFDRCQLNVKAGKGNKWRLTSFPKSLHDEVRHQIESVKVLWKRDQTQNPNGVALPGRYRIKCPSAGLDLRWYWLFPSDTLSVGDEKILCRWHRHEDHIGRQISQAAKRAGIMARVTSHTLRHSYATHAHEMGVPMRTLQQLLGHSDIRTTEIYVHSDEHAATAAKNPLELLLANPQPQPEITMPESGEPKLRLFVG